MKISLFVHELIPQVGHSRAMIELLNGLTVEQKNQITLIEAVTFECGDLDVLFPEFKCKKKKIEFPFKNAKPFISKMFIYHVLSYFYSILFCRNKIKIGIGIASLNVDISNIQFIHDQWKDEFFKRKNFSLISLIYKKILFIYFHIGELILFNSSKRRFIVIANFLKSFILRHYQTNEKNIFLIPSGVNLNEFSLDKGDPANVIDYLTNKHSELNRIDFSRPVFLFVGAYERKGLQKALDYLNSLPGSQLIIIGKPESYSQWNFNLNITIARIEFTKEVNLFYYVSDIFIFPTIYEPFGLVILEAFIMGLDVLVPNENVGASEILSTCDGLYFFTQSQKIPQINCKKLSIEEKKLRSTKRRAMINEYSWNKSAEIFYSILSKN